MPSYIQREWCLVSERGAVYFEQVLRNSFCVSFRQNTHLCVKEKNMQHLELFITIKTHRPKKCKVPCIGRVKYKILNVFGTSFRAPTMHPPCGLFTQPQSHLLLYIDIVNPKFVKEVRPTISHYRTQVRNRKATIASRLALENTSCQFYLMTRTVRTFDPMAWPEPF